MISKLQVIIAVFLFLFSINSCYALIKMDDESVDLAIKYGIQMSNEPTHRILGANWINDGTGNILNIYSPFMQIAIKTSNQGKYQNTPDDMKLVRNKINSSISKVLLKKDVRFIVALYGDTEDFARKYKAYIVDADKYILEGDQAKKVKPSRSDNQKLAEKDLFHPKHPFSAVNCYVFKFNDIEKLKEYYFILATDKGEEIKYKINNNEIF